MAFNYTSSPSPGTVRTKEVCKDCNGSGFDGVLVVDDCSFCNGVGYREKTLLEDLEQELEEFPYPESWMDYLQYES